MLFKEYVRLIDRKLSVKSRYTIFVVDICSLHGATQNLQVIKTAFLPPNTTAVPQPMDQNVIWQAQKIYGGHLLRRFLLFYENGKGYKTDLFGAISLMAHFRRQLSL